MARTKSSNKNLRTASRTKNDDFYTQRLDIEEELKHYKPYFKGKTVLCNCDDPRISEFFQFFANKFKSWELNKLITTCYKNENVDFFSENKSERAIYLEYTGEKNGGRVPTPEEIGIKQLNGNGDFRSKECIELLKQVDIVVTNPPFSLFREYVNQLMEYNKKFLIIGNVNALTYKEIFKLIKENRLWLGISPRSMNFKTPSGEMLCVNACWFTNLPNKKRNEGVDLYQTYKGNEAKFPKYDNYDAINIDKTKDIPKDYEGVMGVPITFMDNYNPNQFELLGIMNTGEKNEGIRYEGTPHGRPIVNGIEIYLRILIKNKRSV